MKIQINSLEALERLIGGDTQLEFDIRQSVVEAFAKKHLKSIANSEFARAAENTIERYIKDELTEEVKTGQWTKAIVLKGEYANAVQGHVNNAISDALRNYAKDLTNIDLHKERIDEIVKRQTDYIVGQWTHGNIEQRINAAVNARLKEKLGL